MSIVSSSEMPHWRRLPAGAMLPALLPTASILIYAVVAVQTGQLSQLSLRTCLSDPFAPRSHFYSQEITRVRLAGRAEGSKDVDRGASGTPRSRHCCDGLKEMVSTCAVEEMAQWLERADPPRSEKATPVLPVVSAIAWHLRVGGPWRALPGDFPAWRTV